MAYILLEHVTQGVSTIGDMGHFYQIQYRQVGSSAVSSSTSQSLQNTPFNAAPPSLTFRIASHGFRNLIRLCKSQCQRRCGSLHSHLCVSTMFRFKSSGNCTHFRQLGLPRRIVLLFGTSAFSALGCLRDVGSRNGLDSGDVTVAGPVSRSVRWGVIVHVEK